MHVIKEATGSSKIEDTRTEIEDAILPEEEITSENRDDWREVNNYTRALNQAIERLQSLPYSNRLLQEAHHTLLQSSPRPAQIPRRIPPEPKLDRRLQPRQRPLRPSRPRECPRPHE